MVFYTISRPQPVATKQNTPIFTYLRGIDANPYNVQGQAPLLCY